MDMDFTFAATSTTATATTTTPEPPAAVVAGPLSAAACRQLPFPRLAAASSTAPCRSPPSPPAAAALITLTAMAAARQGPPGAGADAASAAVEDRMDLLWEDFNEELARGGSCRAAAGLVRGLWPDSDSDSETSDAESEPAAARGCAPALRPSSRAGAVRHCRRRAGTWVLLIRIFRRLFVIEKTVAAAAAATARSRAS